MLTSCQHKPLIAVKWVSWLAQLWARSLVPSRCALNVEQTSRCPCLCLFDDDLRACLRFLALLPVALPPVFRFHFLTQSLLNRYYFVPDLKAVVWAICAVSLPTASWSALPLQVTVLIPSVHWFNPSTIRPIFIVVDFASGLLARFTQVQSNVNLFTIFLTATVLSSLQELHQPFKTQSHDQLRITANLPPCIQNLLFTSRNLRCQHCYFVSSLQT